MGVGLIEEIEEKGSLRLSFEGAPQFFKPVILDLFSSDYCKMRLFRVYTMFLNQTKCLLKLLPPCVFIHNGYTQDTFTDKG